MPTNLVGLSRRGAFGKTRRSTKQSFSFEFPTVFLVFTEIIRALGSICLTRESQILDVTKIWVRSITTEPKKMITNVCVSAEQTESQKVNW